MLCLWLPRSQNYTTSPQCLRPFPKLLQKRQILSTLRVAVGMKLQKLESRKIWAVLCGLVSVSYSPSAHTSEETDLNLHLPHLGLPTSISYFLVSLPITTALFNIYWGKEERRRESCCIWGCYFRLGSTWWEPAAALSFLGGTRVGSLASRRQRRLRGARLLLPAVWESPSVGRLPAHWASHHIVQNYTAKSTRRAPTAFGAVNPSPRRRQLSLVGHAESLLCCLSIAASLLLLTCASKGSFSHAPRFGFVRFKPRSVIFWRGPFCCAPSEYLQSSLHKGACGSNTS